MGGNCRKSKFNWNSLQKNGNKYVLYIILLIIYVNSYCFLDINENLRNKVADIRAAKNDNAINGTDELVEEFDDEKRMIAVYGAIYFDGLPNKIRCFSWHKRNKKNEFTTLRKA